MTASTFIRKIGSFFHIISRKIDKAPHININSRWFETSYSQSGEDLIINYVAKVLLGIKEVSYIDVGAMHPCAYSNTYHFYEKNETGICIEANPNLIPDFHKYRPNDNIINAGVVGAKSKEEKLKFYIFNDHSLSTFDENEAVKNSKINGNKIIDKIYVKTITLNSLLETKTPTFISIDIEGLDFELIKSIDFEKYKIPIICIETNDHITEEKNYTLINYIENQGYFRYADTLINSIFVQIDFWNKRFEKYRT